MSLNSGNQKKIPAVPDDILDGFPHSLLECWEDSRTITGLAELIWSELNNLDLMFDFIANAKDEYLNNLRQEIMGTINECKAGDGGSKGIVQIISGHVKSFRSKIKEEDFTKYKGLVNGALKQNGAVIEKYVPELMEKVPDNIVSNLQDAFASKTGRRLDRSNVALHLQDTLKDMRLRGSPLEDSIKSFATKIESTSKPLDAVNQASISNNNNNGDTNGNANANGNGNQFNTTLGPQSQQYSQQPILQMSHQQQQQQQINMQNVRAHPPPPQTNIHSKPIQQQMTVPQQHVQRQNPVMMQSPIQQQQQQMRPLPPVQVPYLTQQQQEQQQQRYLPPQHSHPQQWNPNATTNMMMKPQQQPQQPFPMSNATVNNTSTNMMMNPQQQQPFPMSNATVNNNNNNGQGFFTSPPPANFMPVTQRSSNAS